MNTKILKFQVLIVHNFRGDAAQTLKDCRPFWVVLFATLAIWVIPSLLSFIASLITAKLHVMITKVYDVGSVIVIYARDILKTKKPFFGIVQPFHLKCIWFTLVLPPCLFTHR